MDNPISINLGDNNTMESLLFHWCAEFDSGEVINQFDGGLDKNYKNVRERLNELSWFILYNKNNKQDRFLVDLKNGFIYRNGIIQDYSEENKDIKTNIRLIYLRRIRVLVTGSNQKVVIHYFLGFQYNDKNGYNRQIVLQIDECGSIVIGE